MTSRMTTYVKRLHEAGVDPKIASAHAEALEQVLATNSHDEDKLDLKTKYAGYIAIYCNIDTILWRNMATVMAVTALVFAIMGTLVTNPNVEFGPFNHRWTVVICLVLIGFFYLGSWWNFKRMRFHFDRMGNELRGFERNGYFYFRGEEAQKWWVEDASWIKGGVLTLAILMFLSAAYYAACAKAPPTVSQNPPSVAQPKTP